MSYHSGPGSKEDSIDLFRRGEITGLVSCEALAKGFDVPDARVMITARPYRKSLASHIQQLGRIMRAADEQVGKDFGVVLDHAGNYERHAEATERFWREGVSSLDEADIEKVKAARRDDAAPRECGGCHVIMPADAVVCELCGWQRPKRRKSLEQRPGVMVEYSALRDDLGDLWPHVSRFFLDKHPGDWARAEKAARVAYKEVVGRWPERGRPLQPSRSCDGRLAALLEHNRRQWINRQRRKGYAMRKDRGAALAGAA